MVPPAAARVIRTSSMKFRMKKMPRPLDLSTFSGLQGIGDGVRVEPRALVLHLDHQGFRRGAGRQRERNPDVLAAVDLVAMLDGVDDRFAHGDADPVDGVLVEAGQRREAVAHRLDQVQQLEGTRQLEANRVIGRAHRGRVSNISGDEVQGRDASRARHFPP